MNTKKILAFLLAIFMIAPAVNLKVPAATDYVTIFYTKEQHENLETAYGENDTEAVVLTIIGDGELTKEDCDFITQNLTVLSLNLTEAVFKDKKVPDEAFKNYGSLRSIGLPPDTAVIGNSAFESCHELSNIGMGQSLQEIGAGAFSYCVNLEMIALPSSINAIGENAFTAAGLTGIIAMNSTGTSYNAAQSAFSGINAKLVVPLGASDYDKPPFSGMNKVEWAFYTVPLNVYAIAGITVELSADVTNKNNDKAEYQWYYNGTAISGMTGDTLVINNISQRDSGRYGIRVTLDGVSVMFSCMVEALGQTSSSAYYSTENKAPDRKNEPAKNKYDYAGLYNVIKSGKTEYKLAPVASVIKQTIPAGNRGETDYAITIYTKKIRELSQSHKNGYFEFNFENTGRFEVPFSILDNIKNIDFMTQDYMLKIYIRNIGTNQRSLTFTIVSENDKLIQELDLTNLPPVYMYYQTNKTTENHIITIEEVMYAYPVSSIKTAQNMLKFRVTEKSALYTLSTPRKADFSDIKNHWGEREILNAASLHIVEGYPDGNYLPERELTRAEFTAMIARAIYHDKKYTLTSKSFSDVRNTDWFYETVTLAGRMGLLEFITVSQFNPNQAITREEMAYMIAEAYSKLTGAANSTNVNYSDSSEIDSKYLSAVRICTNAGLLQGSNGNFMPKKTLTRAEAAAVLNRLVNLLANNIK